MKSIKAILLGLSLITSISSVNAEEVIDTEDNSTTIRKLHEMEEMINSSPIKQTNVTFSFISFYNNKDMKNIDYELMLGNINKGNLENAVKEYGQLINNQEVHFDNILDFKEYSINKFSGLDYNEDSKTKNHFPIDNSFNFKFEGYIHYGRPFYKLDYNIKQRQIDSVDKNKNNGDKIISSLSVVSGGANIDYNQKGYIILNSKTYPAVVKLNPIADEKSRTDLILLKLN